MTSTLSFISAHYAYAFSVSFCLSLGITLLIQRSAQRAKRHYIALQEFIKDNSPEEIEELFRGLSFREKRKIWQLVAKDLSIFIATLNSSQTLRALVKEGLNIHQTVVYTKGKQKNSETMFTLALAQKLEEPYHYWPLGEIMLRVYKEDLFALKKFEIELKNSKLQHYASWVALLSQYKKEQLAHSRVGHLLQFTA